MIKILGEDFKKALAFVFKARKRVTVADYQKFVLVVPDNNKAEFVFFDGSRELSCKVDAQCETDERVCLQLDKLNGRVSLADDASEIKVIKKDDKAQLVIGRSKLTLATFPAEAYPNFQLNETGTLIEVDAGELRQAVNLVKGPVPASDARPELNGMCFDVSDDGLVLVGTDGKRLNKSKVEANINSNASFSATLPHRSIAPLTHMLVSGEAQIYITESRIIFNTEHGTLKEVRVERAFPAWRRLITNDEDAETRFNVAELRHAVKVARVTANEFSFYALVLNIKDGQTTISSTDGVNNTVEVVECSSTHDYEIAVSALFLDQVLPFMSDGNVTIKYNSKGGNRITIVDGDFMAIIMLVRL